MLAVWECRLGNPVPTGSYLDPTFSFGTRPTISRKPLSAFETRRIHKLKILQRATCLQPPSVRRNTERNDAGRIAVIVRVGRRAVAQESLTLSPLHPDGVATVHYLLFYDVVPDYGTADWRCERRTWPTPRPPAPGASCSWAARWPTPWTGRSCSFEETPRRRLRRSRWPILTLPMAS